MNKKSDTKVSQQLNVLQMLQNQIQLLRILSTEQLKFLYSKHQVIVFARGTVLAKEGQVIDYVGVMLQGSAITTQSKVKLAKGHILGNSITNGFQGQKHCEDIVGESQGVLFAIRVESLLNLQNQILKKKIITYLAQYNLCKMKSYNHNTSSLCQQFEQIDSKSLQKITHQSPILSNFLQLFDLKQKNRLLQLYPVYSAKEKTLIISKSNRPYMLFLIKGQLIAKSGQGLKKISKTIQSGNLFNVQGFIFEHTDYSNVYCLSSQAVFMIIDKKSFVNNFKFSILNSVFKYCLDHQLKNNQQYVKLNNKINKKIEKQSKVKQEQWSPFKKTTYKIEQLPKLSNKQILNKTQKGKKAITASNSIATHQTLYKQYYSIKNNKKEKTKETLFTQQDVNQRLISLKTEQNQENIHEIDLTNKIKRLQNQILSLKETNKALTDSIKDIKLYSMQSNAKLMMASVFKQIRLLENTRTGAISNLQDQKLQQVKIVTLKQAFQQHLRKKKLDVLVAKCAFKWLSITRRSKKQKKIVMASVSQTSLST